jgi:asparagine synthase (glutamine-hydrolysing)
MVLTGEGSDEFLGGYPKHVFERYTAGYQLLPGTLRHRLFEPLVHALPYRFRRIKTAIVNMGLEDPQDRMARWFGALSGKKRDELVAFRPTAGRQSGVQFDTPKENSVLRRILYFDQVSWLPDNLLERGDRMTMAASIEARMPFMDHELAAYVSSLPDTFRVRGRQTKWILRAALKRMLPKTILERPKVGFRVPVNDWFRGTMRDYLNDHLSGTGSQTARYYHRDVLNRLLKEHFTGRQNHEKLLWTLLNLEIWHRQYISTG